MFLQREAGLAKRQRAKLLKELEGAQEALKAFQDISERNCWVSCCDELALVTITHTGAPSVSSYDFAWV